MKSTLCSILNASTSKINQNISRRNVYGYCVKIYSLPAMIRTTNLPTVCEKSINYRKLDRYQNNWNAHNGNAVCYVNFVCISFCKYSGSFPLAIHFPMLACNWCGLYNEQHYKSNRFWQHRKWYLQYNLKAFSIILNCAPNAMYLYCIAPHLTCFHRFNHRLFVPFHHWLEL